MIGLASEMDKLAEEVDHLEETGRVDLRLDSLVERTRTLRARCLSLPNSSNAELKSRREQIISRADGLVSAVEAALLLHTPDYVKVVETTDNNYIFTADGFIAHCVGADLRLGKGFAKALAQKCGRPSGHTTVGSVVWKGDVAHMCTKAASSVRPSDAKHYMRILQDTLDSVMRQCRRKGRDLYIPYLIGCGLDGMDVGQVLALIHRLSEKHRVFTKIVKLI